MTTTKQGEMFSRTAMFASRPVARHTDPETSHEAAASVTKLTEKQEAVLFAFEKIGVMSDGDLLDLYPMFGSTSKTGPKLTPQSPSGLRTRRSELVRKDKLKHVGFKTNASGRKTRTWGVATNA